MHTDERHRASRIAAKLHYLGITERPKSTHVALLEGRRCGCPPYFVAANRPPHRLLFLMARLIYYHWPRAYSVYGLIHVRSPAPPVVALEGLLGILIGEQLPPLLK